MKQSTRAFSSRPVAHAAPTSSSRRRASCSLPLADLAGRSVTISANVPAAFEAPLAAHHRLIGRWVAAREKRAHRYTRRGALERIEKVFDTAVLEILAPLKLADFRVVALAGEGDFPPAVAVICDSIGSLELGWIEKTSVLRHTALGAVAPVGWRARAYRTLVEKLKLVLPVFSYVDMFDEFSGRYWDGEETDEAAIRCQIEYFGIDLEDVDQELLPSAINAKRPDFMLEQNAAPLKDLPKELRKRLKRFDVLHKAVLDLGAEGHAWQFDTELFWSYLPDRQDCSYLPPLTLVPFDHFARELDEACQHGMQEGFLDIAGLCPLPNPEKIDDWLASLKLGVEFLCAAQDLIDFDPAHRESNR